MNQSLAPVVLFVYNRPWHTLQTLEALSKNDLAAESILYIFADGPKDNENEKQIAEIRETRNIIQRKKWCKEVIIKENEKNFGLAQSIINGVTEIVNRHGKIIVLEDDIVTSPVFLKYSNNALEFYKDQKQVSCISGYIYPIKKLPKQFFIKGADCWGWSTWKRAWDLFEKDGATLLKELMRRNLSEDFDFYNSYPYTKMLQDQIEGKNDSWAVRWYASCFLQSFYCLYPVKSFVENIGMDGSGVHSIASKVSSITLNLNPKIIPIEIKENLYAKKKISIFFKDGDTSGFGKLKNYCKASYKMVKTKFKQLYNKQPEIKICTDGWFGNYSSWDLALSNSIGYDDNLILEHCKQSLLKVKNGEAIYERDSVIFDKIQYSWPLTAALLKVAFAQNGILNVLDFGGSLGSSYFQNRNFIQPLKSLKWNIIEQQNFSDTGKLYFENDNLKFYETIDECFGETKPDILIISSVLQYLKEPYQFIEKFIETGLKYIFVDMMPFNYQHFDRLTIQKVPDTIYSASYPCWFLDYQKVLNSFCEKYKLISEHHNELHIYLDGKEIKYRGFFLEKIQ
ncbi:hypothetical protein BH09BAC2_BH09BAC2_15890 [soil metagenome]